MDKRVVIRWTAALCLLLSACSHPAEEKPDEPLPTLAKLAMLTKSVSLTSGGEAYVDFKVNPYEAAFDYDVENGRCAISLSNQYGTDAAFSFRIKRIAPLSDSYADDLPYWVKGPGEPQLIIPYTLDANDMRFTHAQGFSNGEQFFSYLKDSFDVLYAEGATSPKMMTVGLHCRLVGRPGRAASLMRFLDYIMGHDKVWVPTRLQIADHWHVHLKHLAADARAIG